MTVTVHWDNPEKTIMRYDLEGKWTWDEFHPAMQQGVEMRREVAYKVHVIANLENSNRIPNNVLSQLKRLSTNDRENRGLVVFAGGGGFLLAMVRVYTSVFKVSRQYVQVVNTVEDARQLLKNKVSAPN